VIFVDTSFWVATIAEEDAHHREAVDLLSADEAAHLVTSNHVGGETWTFLNRRYGHATAVAFIDALSRMLRVRVEFVRRELEEEALRWLAQHDGREYSFVDATSFALMRKLRIREALTFDADCAAAGFVALRV
jgi:predicted nucleic acid-binding protein